MMNTFSWIEFGILAAAGIFGVLAGLPYVLAMNAKQLDKAPIPRPLLMVVIVVQSAVMIAIATGLGLLAADTVGLGAPLISGVLAGDNMGEALLARLPIALVSGSIAGVLLIMIDWRVFMPHLPAAMHAAVPQVALWKKLMAAFYGGIFEELLMRLFVMSAACWLGGLVFRGADGLPLTGAYVFALVAASMLFGIGHLPATAALTPLTLMLVTRALLLNGIGGVIFGLLYWRYGLETAMIAHFAADIVLQIGGTLMQRSQADTGYNEQAAPALTR